MAQPCWGEVGGSNVSPPPSWHCSYLGKEDPMPSGTIMFMLLSPVG